MNKSNKLHSNIQTTITEQTPPCIKKKIDRTTYLVELHFNANSSQSVEDKLKRVIFHDLEYGNQGRIGKFDEK